MTNQNLEAARAHYRAAAERDAAFNTAARPTKTYPATFAKVLALHMVEAQKGCENKWAELWFTRGK